MGNFSQSYLPKEQYGQPDERSALNRHPAWNLNDEPREPSHEYLIIGGSLKDLQMNLAEDDPQAIVVIF